MLSVIIPTYNGKNKVIHALKSLGNQTFQNFEVLVVIDGSTDGTLEYLQNAPLNIQKLTIISQENGGRSKVRNKGASLSQGSILVFMDDDMTFDSNTLEKHWNHHMNHPQSAVSGATFEKLEKSVSDFDRYKSELRNSWLEKYKPAPYKQTDENIYLSAANLSISKELFNCVNGFNETLTDNEDQELGIRLSEQGASIFIDTTIVGYHNENLSIEQYISRQLQYAKSKNSTFPKTFKNWFGRFIFGNRIWIQIINSNRLLLFLPKKTRYCLYKYVIQGNLLKKLVYHKS